MAWEKRREKRCVANRPLSLLCCPTHQDVKKVLNWIELSRCNALAIRPHFDHLKCSSRKCRLNSRKMQLHYAPEFFKMWSVGSTVWKILQFTCHSDLMWNQVNLNHFQSLKSTKIQSWETREIVKMEIFEIQTLPKLISRKIEWQITSCIMHLNFTFWKFLEHSAYLR